jgi:hypothetical protein
MSNCESKIVKNRSDQKKNSKLWRICVGNFFRLSAFFSVALTVSLGLLSWHSDCCHCSAPKRRLRWQKGGSGKGHVSQCWPRIWGVLHAGISFLLLLVTASLFPLISSLVSPFSFVYSLSSSVFFIVSCVIFRRVSCISSLISRLSSTFPLLSSVFTLHVFLVSPVSTVSFLYAPILSLLLCVLSCRVSCLLSLFSRLAATLSLLLSVFSLNPSPFHLLFCVFSLLSLPLSLFHVLSFFFSFISFVCPLTFFCRLVCVTSSRVSLLFSVYPRLSCTLTFLSFALLSFFVSLLATASSLLSVLVVPFLYSLHYFLVCLGAL